MLMQERLQHIFTGWVDSLYRRLNGKGYLPNWSLRATVGFPADFETIGAEFLAYLKLLCGLKSDNSILDIGCGCGMMALQLRGYLTIGGRYVGMDIDPVAIEWCNERIASRDSRFRFFWVDLANPRYNPTGTGSAASFRFPDPDLSYDVVLLKSVFTHMRPDSVKNYLCEIRRLLKPGGCCLTTFFLLNDEQKELERQGKNVKSFKYGDDDFRYADEDLPEKAVAYREGFVFEMLKHSGLALPTSPHYGSWSGRCDGLSFQDILLVCGE
jgi:SAM-dependent methyltransferase